MWTAESQHWLVELSFSLWRMCAGDLLWDTGEKLEKKSKISRLTRLCYQGEVEEASSCHKVVVSASAWCLLDKDSKARCFVPALLKCPAVPSVQNWQKPVGSRDIHVLSEEVWREVVFMEKLAPKSQTSDMETRPSISTNDQNIGTGGKKKYLSIMQCHQGGVWLPPNLFCSRTTTPNVLKNYLQRPGSDGMAPTEPWSQHHLVCLGLHEGTWRIHPQRIRGCLGLVGLQDVWNSVPAEFLQTVCNWTWGMDPVVKHS